MSETHTPLEMLALLQATSEAALIEAGHVTTFRAYREKRNGDMLELTIAIHDRGPKAGPVRYSCMVTGEDGSMATGNPDRDLDVVLSTVHWNELD